jgi:hypothetical protein
MSAGRLKCLRGLDTHYSILKSWKVLDRYPPFRNGCPGSFIACRRAWNRNKGETVAFQDNVQDNEAMKLDANPESLRISYEKNPFTIGQR